ESSASNLSDFGVQETPPKTTFRIFGRTLDGGGDMSRQTALFVGVDTNLYNNLWVTDGTSAGTHELTGIGGVLSLNPSDLTAFDGEVLFSSDGLWVTNGTA